MPRADDYETDKIKLIMELRQLGVHDKHVLSAIESTPREIFVLPEYSREAYADTALPIDCAQTISQPLVVGIMTQALKLEKRLRVLEIGTGSGYQAAILSRLCRRVYTIERHRKLMRQAEERFENLGLHNITTRIGDGAKGWPEQAPFDRIIVTAAAPVFPQALFEQLAMGGIMVVPIGPVDGAQEIVRITRTPDGHDDENLLPVRFVPLLPGEPGKA